MNRFFTRPRALRPPVARCLLGAALFFGLVACGPIDDDPVVDEVHARVTVANFGPAFGAFTFAAFAEGEYTERVFAEDLAPGAHVAGVEMPADVDLSFPYHVFTLNAWWDYTLIRAPDSQLRLLIDHMGQTDPARAYLRFLFLPYRSGSALRRFENRVDGQVVDIPWDDFVDVDPGEADIALSATSGQFDTPLYDLPVDLGLEAGHYYTLVVYPAAPELNTDDPQYAAVVLRHGPGNP